MVTAYRAERRTDLLQTPRILCPVSVGGGGTENALCPRRFSCQSPLFDFDYEKGAFCNAPFWHYRVIVSSKTNND